MLKQLSRILQGCFITSLALFAVIKTKAQTTPSVKPQENVTLPGIGGGQTVAPVPLAYAGGIPLNYVRTYTADIPVADAVFLSSNTRSLREVKQTTAYFDGLGRPLQTVGKKMAANGNDMVTPVIYDAFGREAQQYLPYVSTTNTGTFKTDPFNEQKNFYTNTPPNPSMQGELMFYSQTQFEASPLNRVLKTMAPGNSWGGNGRGVTMSYEIAGANEVRLWNIVSTGLVLPTSTAFYLANELFRTITTDEQGKRVVEYKDKEGKVLLKKVEIKHDGAADITSHAGWLSTYYIYDDLSNLRMVLQPLAVEKLIAASWAFDGASFSVSTIAKELCFIYEYDKRNRMIVKKVPGAGEVYMVYDQRDRLVMTQDANMRTGTVKWMVTKYDTKNRPFETGLWNNNGNTHAQHQTAADASSNYPLTTSGYEELSKTYYDDYTWINGGLGLPSGTGSFNTTSVNGTNFLTVYNQTPDYAQQITPTQMTVGMVTGTRVKVLGTASTFLYTITYYDEKGRPIQEQTTNSNGGYDIATSQYDFAGKVLRTHQLHKLNTSTTAIEQLSYNYYDDAGRVVKTSKKLNGGAEKTISRSEYNVMGQLKTKKLGNRPGTSIDSLAALDYDYNIRGWLTGINRNYARAESAQGITANWFGMELNYDYGFTKDGQAYGLYNGNISGIKWRSTGDGEYRSYGFGYDPANRLLYADFNQRIGAANWNKTITANLTIDFSMSMGNAIDPATAYDANGNIKQMQQRGVVINASPQIDNLTYSYVTNTNKLDKVIDGITVDNKLGDFKDGTNGTTTDYSYDNNGNLTLDNNKAISSITYNHLNLPSLITITGKGTITYTYDAGGNKLKKVTVENPTSANGNKTITTITNYIGGFVYESKTFAPAYNPTTDYTDRLQFFGHEEGRVRALYTNGTSNIINGFTYDYMIKDHLGNVRMVLTEEQKATYYPASTLEGTYSPTDPQANSMINEEKKYYNIDNSKVVLESSIPSWGTETLANTKLYYNHNDVPPLLPNPNYPSGVSPTQTTGSTKLYKLHAQVNKTGLEFIMKVMAGDKVDIFGRSYYLNTTNITNANSTLLDLSTLMANLLLAPVNPIGAKGVSGSQLNTWNNGLVPATFFRGNNNEPTTTVPKAYINYIFLDEQFRYAGGGFSRVGSSGTVKDHWNVDAAALQNINVPKNGYLFVYVSNESNLDVFFDNLQVVHKPGPLIEETHYYPFGLVMSGISSQALPSNAPNRIKFNGYEQQNKEFSDGSGLEWYDYKHRFYDNQIGRFFTQDRLADEYVYYSPYQFAGNEVPNAIDLDGLEPLRSNDSKKRYEQAYNQSLQTPKQNSNTPLLTGTAAVTKGDIGTAAFEFKLFNVKVGVTSSHNEQDVVGVRDNQPVADGTNPQTLDKQTRNGASIGVGVVGVSDQDVTTTNTMTGQSKTESVQEVNVGPVTFNSNDESKLQFQFKAGFGYGIELSGSVNFGGTNGAMMPPSMQDNRIDNTSNKIVVPKLNITPPAAPAPSGKPLVLQPPTQKPFTFRPF